MKKVSHASAQAFSTISLVILRDSVWLSVALSLTYIHLEFLSFLLVGGQGWLILWECVVGSITVYV